MPRDSGPVPLSVAQQEELGRSLPKTLPPQPKSKRTKRTGTALPEIPDKLYFRIGEVARLLDVAPFVLRFWESEFPQLKPGKGGTGQRLYRRRDVETAIEIRRLLYDEGFTIPGARQLLQGGTRDRRRNDAVPDAGKAPFRRLRQELEEIAGILARPVVMRQPNTAAAQSYPRSRERTQREASLPLFARDAEG